MKSKLIKRVVAGASLLLAGLVHAEITLKAVSAWPEGNLFSVNFERFVAKVNAEGKGVVQINYLGGGAKVMPPFEVGNAVKNGVVDMANVAGGFYTNVLPEADALFFNTVSTAEQRNNGAYEYINKLWGEKMNVTYLARSVDLLPFHIFLKQPITKPDLTGMRMRVIPAYRPFLESLNTQSMLTIPPGEVYTALERNLIDGYVWPVIGIFDVGIEKQTKYRVEPGFYNGEAGVLINLATWTSMSERERQFLTRMGVWLESQNVEMAKVVAEEKRRQEAAGIKAITFTGSQAQEYVKKAYDSAWAAIIKRSPEHGPKLRALLTKS
nr:TRAP-type C4-dicarboxylate transport system, periplasmic component [uncultured bacterium]